MSTGFYCLKIFDELIKLLRGKYFIGILCRKPCGSLVIANPAVLVFRRNTPRDFLSVPLGKAFAETLHLFPEGRSDSYIKIIIKTVTPEASASPNDAPFSPYRSVKNSVEAMPVTAPSA